MLVKRLPQNGPTTLKEILSKEEPQTEFFLQDRDKERTLKRWPTFSSHRIQSIFILCTGQYSNVSWKEDHYCQVFVDTNATLFKVILKIADVVTYSPRSLRALTFETINSVEQFNA